MKTITLILVISLSLFNIEDGLFGTYHNKCNDKLILKSDSTFYYSETWGEPEWSVGHWKVNEDELILTANGIYDTAYNGRLILSNDTVSERLKKDSEKLKSSSETRQRDKMIKEFMIGKNVLLNLSASERSICILLKKSS